MSLRDQAIEAMAQGGKPVYDFNLEGALGGLLQWLRDNQGTVVNVHGDLPLGALDVATLPDLLAYGGEETQ